MTTVTGTPSTSTPPQQTTTTIGNNKNVQHEHHQEHEQSFAQMPTSQIYASLQSSTQSETRNNHPPPAPHPVPRPQRSVNETCSSAAHKYGHCEPCRHFLKGDCKHKECRFCHHPEDLDPLTEEDPCKQSQFPGWLTYPVFEWEEDEEGNLDKQTGVSTAPVYNHSATRLEGEEGLLIDTGSKDNLTGSDFVERQTYQASRYGYDTTWQKLTKPKILAGVGKGAGGVHRRRDGALNSADRRCGRIPGPSPTRCSISRVAFVRTRTDGPKEYVLWKKVWSIARSSN